MIATIRKKLVHGKIYLNRALGYASLVNMALILFVALSNLEKYGIDVLLGRWLIPIFAALFLLLFLFGYLEDKFGFFSEEQKIHSSRNPQLNEILKRLEKIEKAVAK